MAIATATTHYDSDEICNSALKVCQIVDILGGRQQTNSNFIDLSWFQAFPRQKRLVLKAHQTCVHDLNVLSHPCPRHSLDSLIRPISGHFQYEPHLVFVFCMLQLCFTVPALPRSGLKPYQIVSRRALVP
jgi:hypothetical protein